MEHHLNTADVLGVGQSGSHRRPARDLLRFRSAVFVVDDWRIFISGFGGFGVVFRRPLRLRLLLLSATTAADRAADIAIDVAKRGGHETAQMGDRQQRQRNTEDGVDDRDHLAPRRPRRYVSVTCAHHIYNPLGV